MGSSHATTNIPVIFPLPLYPRAGFWDRYVEGEYWVPGSPSSFMHRRDGGPRKHAAVDLYAPPGTIVMAMADGIVVDSWRTPYFTRDDETPANKDHKVAVGALAVEHPGLGIIRYCEMGHRALGIGWHCRVRQGQVLGTVGFQGAKYVGGKLVPNPTMLHLEWYSNWQDNAVDPTFDKAKSFQEGGTERLSEPGWEYVEKGPNGKPIKVKHPGNLDYDRFPQGTAFERRHDLNDPTELMESLTVTSMGLPPRHYTGASKATISLPPSLYELLRSAPVQMCGQSACCLAEVGKR